MKRYNINVYNGWPIIFDLSICFIYAAILPLYLLAFTPLIIIFIKNQRVYYLLWLICAIISAIIVAIVVFPVPGLPYKIIEQIVLLLIIFVINLFSPRICC